MGIDSLIAFCFVFCSAFKTTFSFYLFQSNVHTEFVKLCSEHTEAHID